MATPHPASPQPDTGLPPGVEVGGLGPRLVAYVIDALPPAILGVILSLIVPSASTRVQIIVGIVMLVAILGWILFVLQGIAVRAASPGMRIMKLQLVGFYDGRPIGWGRALLRAVVFGLIQGTGVVLIVMLVLMAMHPRRQGWHDLVGQAVMIKERSLPNAAAPDQAGLAGQSDPGSGQLAALFPPSDSAPQDYSAGPPLAPPAMQSPVAGAPVPPPSYGPPAQYSPAPDLAPPSASPSSAPSRPDPAQPAAARPGPAPAAPAQQRPNAPAPNAPASSAPTPPEAHWLAVLDDGREIAVDGLVLLGRNPQPQPGEEDAQLIKLADETRTVSKSHLAVGLDAAGLFVVDRGSTNGSTVTTPAGISTRCQPSQVIYVEPGSVVSIGDHWLEIHRS